MERAHAGDALLDTQYLSAVCVQNEARHQAKKRVDHEKGVDVAGITRNKDFLMHRGSTRDSQVTSVASNRGLYHACIVCFFYLQVTLRRGSAPASTGIGAANLWWWIIPSEGAVPCHPTLHAISQGVRCTRSRAGCGIRVEEASLRHFRSSSPIMACRHPTSAHVLAHIKHVLADTSLL